MTSADHFPSRRIHPLCVHCLSGVSSSSSSAMRNIAKFVLLMFSSSVVILLILVLTEHLCQTTQQHSEFSRQSNWSPVNPGLTRLTTQLKAQSSDGAKFANTGVSTTTSSPPSTVSKDIRKLLEDYVTYLSTLPDFQKETLAGTKTRTGRDSGQNFEFSTPETFTLMSTPMATSSSSNDFKIALNALESRSDNTGGIVLQESPSNTVFTPVHRVDSSNYYLEMPTESGLTLNLSDEELSTFIDNVIGHSARYDSNSTTAAVPLNEFEESALTISPEKEITTPPSVTLEKTLIVISNSTNAHSNVTEKLSVRGSRSEKDAKGKSTSVKPAATTDLPYSRSEIFENSEEIVDTSNEEDINLVSKETSTDSKEFEEPFYTSDGDGEAVTETNTGNPSPDTESVLPGNNATVSKEDETNSNNFGRKLTPLEDTELLHELTKTKDLLRIQIEKLQLLENSDADGEVSSEAEDSDQPTTTTAPEITTVEANGGLRNANGSDLESYFTTTTELPPVTGSELLFETTTVSGDDDSEAIGSTVIDCSPIGTTTTELPNEFNEATTTDGALISENPLIGNHSRANLEESEDTIPTSTEGNDVLTDKLETTTTGNPLGTATSGNELASGAMKTERNADWNTTSIVDGAAERLMATNEAENSTLPIIALDLTGANSTLSYGNATINADDNGRNETDSETMILTHVPKITIIHKIMKPSGSGNARESQEEAYREALRKHKDLIKTAMSSISLVPAAFKRYRINNNNKVNIGEIYLLPNFAGSAVNGRVRDRGSPQKVTFKRQFVQELGHAVTKAAQSSPDERKPIIIRQARPNIRPKFAFNRIGNKFNVDEVPLVSAPTNDEQTRSRVLQENRAKLYLSYLNSMVAKNQNPENIIKLYRPRFIHRKRFKKVRIPTGYRVKKKVPLTTITTSNSTSGGKQMVTFLNASPILITIAQSSELHNQTVQKPTLLPPPPPQVPSHQQQSPSLISSSQLSAHELHKKELTNRRPIDKSKFKVFCTYDAHRSLSFPSNDSRGRFFDIHQLEQNSAILEQCTHLVYAFASINMNGEVLPGAPVSKRNDPVRNETEQMNLSTLVRIKSLKERFPHLRVLVAVGGWNTPPQLFSLLVATSKLRDRLSQNVHKFVLNYNFDGAILAWFYPVYGSKPVSSDSQRSPRSTSGQTLFQLDDKQNLVKFMRSLRNRFDSIPHKALEIGLLSPPFEEQIDRGYDVAKLRDLVDHIIVMSFDYFGSWDDRVHHFAPLYPLSKGLLTERDRKLNINYTLNYWLNDKQAPRDKIVLGVAFYGRSFTLESPSNAEPGAKAIGPGIAGPITNKPGLLAFNELCDLYLGHPAVRLNEDAHRITAHLQLFDQWVGFDDELSLYLKTKYAISNHLSGLFIWSINHDDYRNRCGWGRFPLLKAINKAVEHCQASAVPCRV